MKNTKKTAKTEQRKCAVCGKAFTPKSHNSTVCSDKCRKAKKIGNEKARRSTAAKAVDPAMPEKVADKKRGKLRFKLIIAIINPGKEATGKAFPTKLKKAKV